MFKDGDSIYVTAKNGGQTVAGKILMITPNQVSALLEFVGMLGNHAGYMAVQRHDANLGVYRSIIDGTEITMRSRQVAKPEGREPNAETIAGDK